MEVDRAVVPIFLETEIPKNVSQIGSAVFVEIENVPFLLTSAHVTDDLENGKLLVPAGDGISEIEGYQAHLDLPPEISRNDDSIDMSYYRLTSTFASELRKCFVPIVRNIEIIPDSLKLGVVSVVGYPASKGKRKGFELQSELAYYRGVAAKVETYEKCGMDSKHNIVIHYSLKRAVSTYSGKKVNPPHPNGVSGGAIFSWPNGNEISENWETPKLIGILHSYRKSDGIFIGTTLLPYLSAMALGHLKGFNGVS